MVGVDHDGPRVPGQPPAGVPGAAGHELAMREHQAHLDAAMAIDLASAALADCEQLGTAGRAACLDRALQIEILVTRDGE